jgi:uncharacterized damage-inducible protein DinB
MLSVKMLTQYKAWANELIFSTVESLPECEATKERPTRFKNMVHTLNHIYVIDCIFKAHLEGKQHSFKARNTLTHPSFHELWESVKIVDQWYVDYASSVPEQKLTECINFQFVDGGEGVMSRIDMILHIVNHGTYHRGFVGDMMYQVPIVPPATDLPVFLRDFWASSVE